MTTDTLPTVCPRCERPLVLNHDVRECLTHGEIHAPTRAWELVPRGDVDREDRSRVRQPRMGEKFTLTALDRRILAGLEDSYAAAERPECELCFTTWSTPEALAIHEERDHADPEPNDPVRWIAWRVRNGQPVSAAIVAERFRTTERQGSLWMAGGWSAYL